MIDPQTRLIERCSTLVEDFTCQLSGLPTPDRQAVREDAPARIEAGDSQHFGPYPTYDRILLGIAPENVIAITETRLSNADPTIIGARTGLQISRTTPWQAGEMFKLTQAEGQPTRAQQLVDWPANTLGDAQPESIERMLNLLERAPIRWVAAVSGRVSLRGIRRVEVDAEAPIYTLDDDRRMFITHASSRESIRLAAWPLHGFLGQVGAVDIAKL